MKKELTDDILPAKKDTWNFSFLCFSSIGSCHCNQMGVLRIVKFGGAAVTDKRARWTLKEECLNRCSTKLHTVLKEEGGSAIVVHGAGSFGHFEGKYCYSLLIASRALHLFSAKQYAIGHTVPMDDSGRATLLRGVMETRIAVKSLNNHVVCKTVHVLMKFDS